jgi:hypothetical protein
LITQPQYEPLDFAGHLRMDVAAYFLAALDGIQSSGVQLNVVFQLAVGSRLPAVLGGWWGVIARRDRRPRRLRALGSSHKPPHTAHHIRMDVAAYFFPGTQGGKGNVFQFDDVLELPVGSRLPAVLDTRGCQCHDQYACPHRFDSPT